VREGAADAPVEGGDVGVVGMGSGDCEAVGEADVERSSTPKGTLVLSGGGTGGPWLGPLTFLLRGLVLSPFVGQTLRSFVAKLDKDDLVVLKELVEAGKITPDTDRAYALSQVPEAIGYLEAGHARGKVVITV
jgi:NADPH:quinone reductase-like Zn-dependent oxidoreductase